MKRLIPLALALAVAAPATAQVRGSINRDAPSVTSAIQFANGEKISITYKAIHFGEGQWKGITEAGEESINRFNEFAARSPIGEAVTTLPCSVAGRDVPAGTYKLYFTVHPRFGWILNMKSEEADEPIRWGLQLEESDEKKTRLQILVTPAAEADRAMATIAFGNSHVTVPVTPPQPDDGDQDGDQDGER